MGNTRRSQGSVPNSNNNCDEVCQGMRGLLGRANNREARTRVPMLPAGATTVTQSMANYTSSRRRSRNKNDNGNFLAHSSQANIAPSTDIHTQRSNYESARKTRQVSWWG